MERRKREKECVCVSERVRVRERKREQRADITMFTRTDRWGGGSMQEKERGRGNKEVCRGEK